MRTHPNPGRTPQTGEFTEKAIVSSSVEFIPTYDPMKTPRKGIVLRLSSGGYRAVLTLGAPFWNDVLQGLMGINNT